MRAPLGGSHPVDETETEIGKKTETETETEEPPLDVTGTPRRESTAEREREREIVGEQGTVDGLMRKTDERQTDLMIDP